MTPTPVGPARGIRAAGPEDYDRIAAVVDDWWGRPILPALPRLFLDHFHATSLVVETDAQESGQEPTLRGFLVGFDSPSLPAVSYVHFVGVAPAQRGSGLGRALYQAFLARARADGRREVRAVTAPGNTASVAFHRALGFTAHGPLADYNGPGRDLVTFRRAL